VTENTGDVAMVLITPDKTVYINEDARAKLMEFWPAVYAQNIEMFIPAMVQTLLDGNFFETGCKIVDTSKQKGPRKSAILNLAKSCPNPRTAGMLMASKQPNRARTGERTGTV